MPTIYEYVNATEVATYVRSIIGSRAPYLGEELFPIKKQIGLDLTWIKGNNGLPVILTPTSFDSKANIRDRKGIKGIETEMPFFREGIKLGEKDRQEINKVINSGNSKYIEPLISKFYDDVVDLVKSADVSMEAMRMQLLTEGKVVFNANRIQLDYDYNFDVNHKESLLESASWSKFTTANPVLDIQRWKAKIKQDTGKVTTRAICNTKTWGYLMLNDSIRKDINTNGNVILTDAVLKNYFKAKLDLVIEVYDEMYKDDSNIAKPFFADNIFTLLPGEDLGSSWYGTTPEESDLMAGSEAEVELIKDAVAITTIKETHPVNVLTLVSSIMLPSFENINSIFIAKVA